MAHEKSATFGLDDATVLLKTVVDGEQKSMDEAFQLFKKGENPAMGFFRREDELIAAQELFSQTDNIPFPKRKPSQEQAESSAPRRKPDFDTLQTMKNLDEFIFGSEEFSEQMLRNPVAQLGKDTAKVFPLLAGDIDSSAGRVIGRYNPGKVSVVIEDEVKRLGLADSNLKFDSDLITLGASGIPADTSRNEISTILHEYRHRGLQQLRNRGVDVDAFYRAIRKKFSVWIDEEVLVRLLGFASDTDVIETRDFAEKTFKINFKELLADPEMQLALLTIQKASAELIKERFGEVDFLERSTNINFPPDTPNLLD